MACEKNNKQVGGTKIYAVHRAFYERAFTAANERRTRIQLRRRTAARVKTGAVFRAALARPVIKTIVFRRNVIARARDTLKDGFFPPRKVYINWSADV